MSSDYLTIPCIPGRRAYSVDVDLDGVAYTLRFDWSVREAAWYMSIYDSQQNAITLGRKIVTDWSLTFGVSNPAAPQGVFICSGTDGDPGLDDLGGDAVLYYLTAATDG